MTTALCASLSPVFCDLASDDWISDRGTPVVVVSSASMAAAKQERIVGFLKQGGKVLLAPVVPSVDDNLKPCTLLSDFLGKPSLETSPSEFARVTIEDISNILNNGTVYFSSHLPPQTAVLGKDEHSGKVVCWQQQTEGNGQLIFLGFRWSHAMREHERMLAALLKRLGLEQKVVCSNPNLWTSLRTHETKSVLFVMNLLSSPMEGEVSCRPSWQSEMIHTGHHKLEPMSVKYVELG